MLAADPLRGPWRAWGWGLVAGLAVACIPVLLATAGLCPPGSLPVAGAPQQLGYSFTGLTFLAAAWLAWRRMRGAPPSGLSDGSAQGAAYRGEIRTVLLVSASTTLWGCLYWRMVGWHGARHALTFLVLTPAMYLCFAPRPSRRASRQEVP